MTMIVSPSPRAREIARLTELYRVSYSTAARWIDSGRLDECIARHVDREKLRAECEANDIPRSIAHQRKWEGLPRAALAMPRKRKLKPTEADKWRQYEAGKAEIEATAKSAQEYDERLRWLVAELGL